MSTRIWAATLIVAASAASLAIGGFAAGQETEEAKEETVKIINSEENTISKEIWGTWVMDEELTKHTAHEVPKDVSSFEFKKDGGAEGRIKAALESAVKGAPEGERGDFIRRAAAGVFVTGRMVIKRGEETSEVDFAQVSMWGEPVIMILETEGEETDWESARISFVRDPEGDNDLLFVGGDHKNEPYIAMKRKTE